MQKMARYGTLGVFVFVLGGCSDAVDASVVSAAVDAGVRGEQSTFLAETYYPDPPWDADKVNWKVAARPLDGTNPRSDFMRAQHLMAKLARAAFRDQTEFDAQMNSVGLFGSHLSGESGLFFGASRPDAYVGGSIGNSMTFVAIRGTSDGYDGLSDAFNVPTSPARYGGAPVTLHQGFATYADKVYEMVRPALGLSCAPQPAAQRLPLWVTGHSLGAAAASIVAYRLAQDGCNVAGVSLFGSPRPGFADFQEAYHSPTLTAASLYSITSRWVHQHDPFYCLPPGGAWRPVGIEHRIDDGIHLNTNLHDSQCNTPEEWIGKVRLAMEIIGGPVHLTGEMALAMQQWIHGVLEISLLCRPETRWDDVWSLGACSVVETTGRLAETFHISPEDLLFTAIRLIYFNDHFPAHYADGIPADFSDEVDPNVQWTTLHVRMPPPSWGDTPWIVNMHEQLMDGLCVPDVEADLSTHCEFDVPIGWTARVAAPAADVDFGRECDRVIYSEEELAVCEIEVQRETTVNGQWVVHGF